MAWPDDETDVDALAYDEEYTEDLFAKMFDADRDPDEDPLAYAFEDEEQWT